jgi:hypothetical protein
MVRALSSIERAIISQLLDCHVATLSCQQVKFEPHHASDCLIAINAAYRTIKPIN